MNTQSTGVQLNVSSMRAETLPVLFTAVSQVHGEAVEVKDHSSQQLQRFAWPCLSGRNHLVCVL